GLRAALTRARIESRSEDMVGNQRLGADGFGRVLSHLRKAPPFQDGRVRELSQARRAGTGMSLCGTTSMSLPPMSAAFHAAGCEAISAHMPIGGVAAAAASEPACLPLLRRRRRRSGMGMSTGQTSLQAPQSEEALGRSASSGNFLPASSGESTAPTGPGLTLRQA